MPDFIDEVTAENEKLRITNGLLSGVLKQMIKTMRDHSFKPALSEYGEEILVDYGQYQSLSVRYFKFEEEVKDLRKRVDEYEQQISDQARSTRKTREVVSGSY